MTNLRLSRLRDADPLSVEYFLVKDDDGRMPALERVVISTEPRQVVCEINHIPSI